MSFQNIDFRLNVTPDATNLASLKAVNAELEKTVDLLSRINSSGGAGGGGIGGVGTTAGPAASSAASAAGVGAATGGGGGGGGGGNGGSGAGRPPRPAGSVAQPTASGNAAAAAGFQDVVGTAPGWFDMGANLAATGQTSAANPKETAEQRHARNLRSWQLTMGIQSVGYMAEDMYYSGIRGALNNFPFAAQGLAALAGVNPATSMAVAGVTALTATTGMIGYDNRERIAKSLGINLGTREESILGLPELTGSQKAQKDISDAMYYVDKYGRGSSLGQRYLADAISAMEAQNRDLNRRGTEQDIARIRGLADLGLRGGASVLSAAGLGGDSLAKSLFDESARPSEAQIRKQAENLFAETQLDPIARLIGMQRQMPDSFLAENRAKATEAATKALQAQNQGFASSLASAYSGNSERLGELERQLKEGSLSGRNRELAEEAVKLGRSITPFAADRINTLRSAAGNPYADIGRLSEQIGGYLGDAADTLMPALNEDMRQAQRMAPQTWQQRFAANQQRYVENIAASYGGIKASGSRAQYRQRQIANLSGEIYNDLIASGVPAVQARNLAGQLQGMGLDRFNQRFADSKIPNGFSQMQNFMMGLGEEQQMMFGEFNQNAMQIQMHQQMLRMQRMRRTRFGLRGMN